MDYIIQGFFQALGFLFEGNEELWSAVGTTLKVSSLSILASLLLGVPLGFLLGYADFPGRKICRTLVDTLLALPTVVVGLLVYAFISRRGPLGELGLLFTLPGIALGQTLLALPIVIALTASAVEALDQRLSMTLLTLGAKKGQLARASLVESRYAVLMAGITAYGRIISEVGISMMIGGNIKWHTRTITTAIALETGKGQFAEGIALGLVLLAIAFFVNGSLSLLRRRVQV
ncbi:MAG TPA: ABC transporter permease [Synergistaceae bacterium]|nr:ABC transporter permease [Synergistaceae bacterium]HPJ25943.1 ABC transporter permease [Synergistaceae bacterium]HPQ38272.1 ABC transporter permease [Synergistaceae bacterium]